MSKPSDTKTRLAHMGRDKAANGPLVNTPVMRASTILFDSYADLRAGVKTAFATDTPFYGRMGTPSQWSLRSAISELEGAHDTHLYPSGVAALSAALIAFADAGSHVLITDSVYEPLRGVARRILKRMNIEVEFFAPDIGAGITELMRDNTQCILLESPGSLTFEIQDIPAISAVARAHGAYTIVDNTWGTPLYCNPLALGADVSVNACTKYIVGHSDVMMGAASANERGWSKLDRTTTALGHTVSPDDAYLALRGLRTLDVRLRQHGPAALEIARWLDQHPAIDRVLHPALESFASHALWRRDFRGSTGLFSIILKGGEESDVAAMVDHMQYFGMGFSWGGFESLILPADPTHIRTAKPYRAAGPLLRLHIGLEAINDLKADLSDGLDRYSKHLAAKRS